MLKRYLETGKIVGTHGVKGMMRVQAWCDSADFLKQFKKIYTDKNGENALTVTSCQPHGNVVLMAVKGIDSIERAETLRNNILYINRDDAHLPEGSYFVQDLIGCTVYDFNSNEVLGVVSDVTQTGANDVWHVKKEDKEYLIPVIDEVVQKVDVDASEVFITPLKGIFDDED